MIVTTKQIVKQLPNNLKLMSILAEAITNSIQAHATEIEIHFDTIDVSLLKDVKQVKNITIIDNGDGFTDKNIESFNHYMSEYKQELGCKGIGRFTYLTICDKVEIDSYKNDSNIHFNFSIDIDSISPKKSENSELLKKTKITFHNIQDRQVSANLSKETKEIVNHFLSTFKFMVDDGKNLFIKLYLDDTYITTVEAKEHGTGFKDETFSIKINSSQNEDFTISYKKKGSSIKGFYCADKRSVKRDSLGIKFRTANDSGLLFFVSSEFFDRTVNDERNEFDIKDKNNGFFDNSLDWDTINRKLFVNIDSICKSIGINIEETNQKNQKDSINAAPYLSYYIKQSKNMATSTEIIKEAKELFNADKDYIRNIKNKNKPDYEQRLYTSNQAELAEYIFDREKIINDIKSDIENPNKKSNETIIHNKIMPRRTRSDDYTSYKENNLWLFDERFMIYSYAHSDDTINNILGLNDTDKNTRPDICIFTKGENDIKEIILIELKGSDATGEKNAGGLNELYKYTDKIKEHFEKNGENVLIWSYLVTTFDEQTKKEIKLTPGIKKTYTTKGEMFYLYHEGLNSIIHILTLETMVEDALSRNQLFLDILRGNK